MKLAMVDTNKLRSLGTTALHEIPYRDKELTAYLQGFSDMLRIMSECVHGINLGDKEEL